MRLKFTSASIVFGDIEIRNFEFLRSLRLFEGRKTVLRGLIKAFFRRSFKSPSVMRRKGLSKFKHKSLATLKVGYHE